MLFPRLIPVLLIRNGALEKSIKFRKWSYVGDALNAVRIFNEKEVDEIVLLDVDATKNGSGPNFQLLAEIAGECFMPLSYGGGISNLEQAKQVMGLGIEKVVLNQAAFKTPELIGEVANFLGSSSTVVSFDLGWKSRRPMRWDYVNKNWDKTSQVGDWMKKFQDLGAGEFMLQNIEADGTLKGPDLALAKFFADQTSMPTIVGGGVADLEDAKKLWLAGVSGVAAGSWFVYNGPHKAVLINYPKYPELQTAFESTMSN